MKIKINRNFVWAERFVNHLAEAGVEQVCISPGSRSTPLTLAFDNNKKIKKHIFVDERQSGFFALGLAKQTNLPVAVVTTSGTAAVELYPAIVEAYQNRVSLIICTADRPAQLRNKGANQAINQNNLYKNHIRFFYDAGLPQLTKTAFQTLIKKTGEAFRIALIADRGPVHINFQFDKPLEPHLSTDEISEIKLNELENVSAAQLFYGTGALFKAKDVAELSNKINKARSGLIIVGPANFYEPLKKKIKHLSGITGFPVFADGTSQFRTGINDNDLIIINYDAFLRSTEVIKKIQPDIILQFGRTLTSVSLENYFSKIKSERVLINEFGDCYDPSDNASKIIKADVYSFMDELIKKIDKSSIKKQKDWVKFLLQLDDLCEWIKLEFINNSHLIDETNTIVHISRNIPEKSVLFVSNSTPVRDLDYFLQKTNKNYTVHQNRGASGIDGIISTALGIAEATKERTFLLTGDLAFYYDLTSLHNAKAKHINLTIILINNNGGGLFNFLPIVDEKEVFKKYFRTPLELNFKEIVRTFGLDYKLVKTSTQLNLALNRRSDSPQVIEIQTNAADSHTKRKDYWKNAVEEIDEWLKDIDNVC
ncbi:MAG TPA: 2-succinyl-5-enolpyruvyl-6-hydroxy-3-cyclohexene-1-carboxylic-acid synthase [Ignavibacteriaceae bacterium]|nr:2-succinyl-5-enolpyruvyl-6-hydroxy-3-cyclohexene-1-carboxylic-acid synthase [Ignavibacteriaceae bacterium]